MANPVTGAPEVFATEAAQTLVENGNGGAPVHVEPELWGLARFQIVSISMLVLLLFAFFGAKVHKKLAGGIDGKIAAIKEQLEEAKQLRRSRDAARDMRGRSPGRKGREAMLANARHEADAILEKAEADNKDVVERRADGGRQDRRCRTRGGGRRAQPRGQRGDGGKPVADFRRARCRSRQLMADKVIAGI